MPAFARPLKTLVAAITATAALAANMALATPSTQFSVTGNVKSPTTYDLAALQARPAITQTVNFLSGTTPQTHTYSGASCGALSTAPASCCPPTRASRTTC